MKLISDIINELVDSNVSITSPLLKTKVLASRINNVELLNWVNSELNGYDSEGEVPAYRQTGASISGSYLNGNWQFNNQPLPLVGLPDKLVETISKIEFYQSVTTLESMVKDHESGTLEIVIPADITAMMERAIRKMGNPFFQIVRAQRMASASALTQALSVIRSKLLDFMLKLDSEFGTLTEIADLKKKNEAITQMIHQTIVASGSGNVINTGEAAQITAHISIKQGDQVALKERLLGHGIEEEDVKDLLTVVDTETLDREKGTYGPKVNTWMQRMLGKALDGTWQVSVGAAGNLLASALQAYYGG